MKLEWIVLVILLLTEHASAAFFKWTHRAHLQSPVGPPKNLTPKISSLGQQVEIISVGADYNGAGWRCNIEPERKMWSRTIGEWFLESRSINCEHESGAAESQIATCQYDKSKKKVIEDTVEVNLKFKGSALYVQISCKL